MNKKIIYLSVGIVAVIIALFAFNGFLTKEVIIEAPITQEPVVEIISINNLLVPDQAADSEIFVEKILLRSDEKGGFVVIYEAVETTEGTSTLFEFGDAIASSSYISPGVTDNTLVSAYEDVSLEVGDVLIAVLYADEGDMLWDGETDTLILGDDEKPVQVIFNILSQGDIDIGPKL